MDEVDRAIIGELHHAEPYGILPRDVASWLKEYKLKPWNVTKRIRRMNKKLDRLIGQKAAEKVGKGWALTALLREAWRLGRKEILLRETIISFTYNILRIKTMPLPKDWAKIEAQDLVDHLRSRTMAGLPHIGVLGPKAMSESDEPSDIEEDEYTQPTESDEGDAQYPDWKFVPNKMSYQVTVKPMDKSPLVNRIVFFIRMREGCDGDLGLSFLSSAFIIILSCSLVIVLVYFTLYFCLISRGLPSS